MEDEFLAAVELHSLEGIRAALDAGLDPRAPIRGKPPVDWLIEMYTRSPRFPDCLRLLLDRGAELENPALAAVLLDDATALDRALADTGDLLHQPISVVSAFTPLATVSLLHVASEYGHAATARRLIEHGADVDARASTDEHGLGGHTPLFHTVNSHANYAKPVLRLLLAAGARTDIRLQGITWGQGFPWETTLFDVTPISYAQAGLLPQMHRDPEDVYAAIEMLLRASSRTVPPRVNVPNQYVREACEGA